MINEIKYTLLPCPFCGYQPLDGDLDDHVYPLNVTQNLIRYEPTTIWKAGCNESYGGCTAEVLGDTEQEAIDNWNKRV